MRIYPTFAKVRENLEGAFLSPGAQLVRGGRWQGLDVSTKPEMATRELLNFSFQVPMRGIETVEYWAEDTQANLPWADVHFEERVGGEPLNPGESWKSWPWGHSADKFRHGPLLQFDHTYMERFWPKFSGYSEGGKLQLLPDGRYVSNHYSPRIGIKFEYGDLDDLLQTLQEDPLTRQAYLPIWFPEDGTCKARRPCTLGYHFINRFDYLHVTYYIRSCDFVRHWGDDCYLTVRLLFWVLDRLRERDERWRVVKPGMFTFHCVSLHLFENDYVELQKKAARKPAGNP